MAIYAVGMTSATGPGSPACPSARSAAISNPNGVVIASGATNNTIGEPSPGPATSSLA